MADGNSRLNNIKANKAGKNEGFNTISYVDINAGGPNKKAKKAKKK